ncbi:MAG TPA: glycosyltransferase family 87 protein [Isosphaeraceae bacterium]|nr:glycosyltransferase family 87 protein [Isosphaeraceae bacterium]
MVSRTLARGGAGKSTRERIPKTLVAVGWLSLGLCGWLVMGSIYVHALRPAPDRITDFFQDWASARNHWVGLPVYTHHAKSFPRYLGLPPESLGDVVYNAHPPASVFLVLPLGRLAYLDAVLAWNLVSIAALLASLAIVAAGLPELKALWLPAAALLPFCMPVYGNLQQCQLNLALLLMVTAAWALDRSGRPVAAGMLVGAAAAIKLFPAYLVVYLVARGRWRAVLGAAASFLTLNLATAAVLGRQSYDDYLHIVLPYMRVFPTLGFNFSFAGFWNKLFNPAAEGGVVIPLWASPAVARCGTLLSDLVATAIVAAVAYRARTPARRDLAFGAAVTAMLLVAPMTWDISMVFLLVPIALIARTAERVPGMPVVLVLILTILCVPQSLLTELASTDRTHPGISPAFMLGAASLKFYALLGAFLLGLAAFRAEARSQP